MITVFGSINMDMVFFVKKLPMPGETVICPNYSLIPGGKGANQAVACSRTLPSLSLTPIMLFGNVGKDLFGERLVESLFREKIQTEGIHTTSESTGCASIWVDHRGENSIVSASGANETLSHKQVSDDVLSKSKILLTQLETPVPENCHLITRAFEKGVPVILNTAPAFPVPLDVLKKVSTLVMNTTEAQMIASALHLTYSSFKELVVQLAQRSGGTCIITLGAQGLLAATPNYLYTLETFKVTPIDTTAAGDTFTGALATQLFLNIDLPEALRFASLAASLSCLKKGAQSSIPTYDEIDEKMSLMPFPQEESL